MSIKDFKISAVDTAKGLSLGEVKVDVARENVDTKAYGICGSSYNCSGGGGMCGNSYNCSGG